MPRKRSFFWEPPKLKRVRPRTKSVPLYGRMAAKRMARLLLAREGRDGPGTQAVQAIAHRIAYKQRQSDAWWNATASRRSSHRMIRARELAAIADIRNELREAIRARAQRDKEAWDVEVRTMAQRLLAGDVPGPDVKWAMDGLKLGRWRKIEGMVWPKI